VLLGALALGGAASAAAPMAFRWLVPAAAPAGWKHLRLPATGAILAYPPSLAPIHGDKFSVSVARVDRKGRVHVYLNATPKQGDERLDNWVAFRIAHNRAESKAVHEEAYATGLAFLDGKGSCVIDTYTTRHKANHYREIACFVQSKRSASVIVAAALRSDWASAAPLLERAVSAYRPGRGS
jgi:hypothetical protein